ncbi:hypothetical protein [Spirosoma areae]
MRYFDMPIPTDNIRYFSIIEDSVIRGKNVYIENYPGDAGIIMPKHEAALSWYAKYHPKHSPNAVREAYQWMLDGFEKEVRTRVFDSDSNPQRISVYLSELSSFFNSYQPLKEKYDESVSELYKASDEDDHVTNFYIAAVEGASVVLSIGLEIVNYCSKKLQPTSTLPTSTLATNDEPFKLSHPQIAILYHYTGQPITRNNAGEIAQKYGQNSGQRLETIYKELTSKLLRTAKGKNRVKDIKAVLPLLAGEAKVMAEKELKDAIANNLR